MDAVVMAGGKGERMGGEKPMVLLDGKPLLAYVVEALLGSSRIGRVYVAVSPKVPLTAEYIRSFPDRRVAPVATPGSGYVDDTAYAARALGLSEPFVVVSADLPLITPDVVDRVINEYIKCGKEALSVWVEEDGKATPAGINVVHGAHIDRAQEEYSLLLDSESLVNANYRKDLTYCEQLLKARRR
jgi:adenosylcobinamide-phosphate guanylyltransferase